MMLMQKCQLFVLLAYYLLMPAQGNQKYNYSSFTGHRVTHSFSLLKDKAHVWKHSKVSLNTPGSTLLQRQVHSFVHSLS